MDGRPKSYLEMIYAGEPFLSLDENGVYTLHSKGINQARLNGTLFDVDSKELRVEIKRLREIERVALCNPYREALQDANEVHKEIPRKDRAGMRPADVRHVLDAVVRVASRHVQ